MKPEFQSQYLLRLTRAKGKMYEFGIDEAHHLAIPEGKEPASLFLLTIGILGDYAAEIADAPDAEIKPTDELQFAAKFFDAYLESRFSEALPHDVLLLASSAYYLAERPGSSFVLAKKLSVGSTQDAIEELLRWLLQAKWAERFQPHGHFSDLVSSLVQVIANHFLYGRHRPGDIHAAFAQLRREVYAWGTARNVLFVDVVIAVAASRVESSSWELLPRYTRLSKEVWAPTIQRSHFPKELWPSQIMLGMEGIFNGKSGIVQMPTSAGKTRSLEIILRSAFLAGRAKLAVVVVPFRALCHEVGDALREAFSGDNVKVNELSDALQIDFMAEIAEIFGGEASSTKYVLVLTPEKLLYVLRQQPELANHIGQVAYDEGHQFDSGSRGIVYELLLTEIKALMPEEVQTVLISAVIKNSSPVASWLIGESAVVVNGTSLFPTARSVAFASWMESTGQLRFFDEQPVKRERFDYFVPRVIEQQELNKRKGERKARNFPEKGKDSAKDVSLYLGLSVIHQGAAAVFCGRKDTAEGMASRVVEVYARDYQKSPPAEFSDTNEVLAMCRLIGQHFGEDSDQFKAAALGIYVHHGSTPHGLRLSIEHGMQQGLLKYVICTSTLAQGVNLPIRYLVVSSVYQAGERIKTRDFLNLIGRAGRAGMHTEGLVIFADSSAMDDRGGGGWQFDMSANLLSPEKSEDTSSSLLEIIAPLRDETGKLTLSLASTSLIALLVASDTQISDWAHAKAQTNKQFNGEHLLKQLKKKRMLQKALESYLMSNRGGGSSVEFQARAEELAESTLAYAIGSDSQKADLRELFRVVAAYVDQSAPYFERQHVYAKTLLGVSDARRVDEWVDTNRELLLGLRTNREWLKATWQLFGELIDNQFFHAVLPVTMPFELAELWVEGTPYRQIIEMSKSSGGTKPWGTTRRAVAPLDVMEFVEKTLSFDCSLILSAIAQFLFGSDSRSDEGDSLRLFQKAMKYGIPEWLSISVFEAGLADRVIAQGVARELRAAGYTERFAAEAFASERKVIENAITGCPAYFKLAFSNIS